MAIGFVFEYVLIAALLAPVAWVMWWAAATLGDHSRPVSSPAHAPRIRNSHPSFSFPQPVDMSLPMHSQAITVCRVSDGSKIDTCSGPDKAGRCPRTLANGTVPCAGSMLSLPQPIRGSREWHIPAGYQSCLAGSYAAFRQD
jgi:hypothetical protein